MAGETVIETILIYQEAYYDPAQMVLKVEAKEYSSSAYNNKVYLPLYGAVDVTVNWGCLLYTSRTCPAGRTSES